VRGVEWVIDADAHVTEPEDLWTSRLPSKLAEMVPHVVRDPKTGRAMWEVAGHRVIGSVGHTATAGWPDPFPHAPLDFEQLPAAAYDAGARLAYMDSIGLWAQVMYPNVGGFGNQGFLSLEDADLMLDCVRAYNDWITEWCSVDPRRLLAIAATPFWDVQAAVAEVERCAELGHRGVLFTGEPQLFKLPYLGDTHWDPLWGVAQEARLPISFHIGSGNFETGFTPDRLRAHGAGATYVATSVSLFLENGQQLVDLLTSGVLPRFPELNFVSVESGIGFLPFILEAADYAYGESSMAQERPGEGKPSEYFHRQVFGCFLFEEASPAWVIDAVGPDNLLFETDYPHPICLYGNVREKIESGLAGQPDDVRRKVLWENSARLYRVGQPAVAVPVG
jgi:predicted TIM-barrel fold metal-dependent hydrolase